MSLRIALTAALVVCVIAGPICADELVLDHKRDSQNLAGVWEVLVDHASQAVWKAEVASTLGPWKSVAIPKGNLLIFGDGDWKAAAERAKKTECVWVRRGFKISPADAGRGAVLRWGGIRFGAKVWINGREVAEHPVVGPHTVLLPAGLLKAGENQIVMRLGGWAGIPMSESGYPLLPVGASTQNWGGKGPGIYQDIWLEFYDRAYLNRVLAIPDVKAGTVTFRIELASVTDLPGEVELAAEVRASAGGEVLARETATVRLVGDGAPVALVTCRVPDAKLWTPRTPTLYEATLKASAESRPCDTIRFTFGMRQVTIEDGHFRLNGKPLWLRGSNLVNEWLWGDKYNRNVKRYIVDEARLMNLNVFRTHTQPPPTVWVDTADRHGMMIMAESPLLYNHADFQFTPEEYEVFHANAMLDIEGWITKLWNHPSIIMWVLSNESPFDNVWESGPYYERAKALDPTRPGMRTGEPMVGTPDMVDTHTCFNVVRDAEGQLVVHMADLMARKDPRRPLCNTEYMNRMWDPTSRWLGRKGHPKSALAYAECNAEHTEAMRRLQFDCLLPYMYAGWTRLRGRDDWRDDYPTPMAASLHSSMAPVLASLEMFDRNYVAGATFEVPLALINELHTDVPAKLDLYITPRDPMFVPDADALAAAVWHSSRAVTFAADSMKTESVRIPVPDKEGSYYLAAVIRREGDAPVVSQRVLRAVNPVRHAAALVGLHVNLIGADDALLRFLARHGCKVTQGFGDGRIDGDVVLIGDSSKLHHVERMAASVMLRDFARRGGRVVVTEHTEWLWQKLVECKIGLPEYEWRNPVICSRAHAYKGAEHPVLRDIPADWLWRWNGLPGVIANEIILATDEWKALETARKILWVSRDLYPAVVSFPVGEGEILINQLHIRPRLNPDGKAYDPVAERMMINMLRP